MGNFSLGSLGRHLACPRKRSLYQQIDEKLEKKKIFLEVGLAFKTFKGFPRVDDNRGYIHPKKYALTRS